MQFDGVELELNSSYAVRLVHETSSLRLFLLLVAVVVFVEACLIARFGGYRSGGVDSSLKAASREVEVLNHRVH